MGARTTIRGGFAGKLVTWFAFAVLGSLAIASPLPAFANTYTVEICTRSPDGGNGDGLGLFLDPGTMGFGGRATCNRIPAEIELTARGAEVTGGSRWDLHAPPGTIIRTLTGVRKPTVWQSADIVWEIRNATERLERISGPVPGGQLTYTVNSDLVFAGLVCAVGRCVAPVGSFDTSIVFENLVATLEDNVAPTVALDPPPPSPGTVSGTVEIPFVAHDEGSGVFVAELFVDGRFVSLVTDRNDGRCTFPIRFLVPCKLDLRSSIPLDTTRLSDGTHEVEVVAFDIANESAIAGPFSIEVRNTRDPVEPPPLNTGPPLNADRTAPVLSGASLSRKRFRVGKARTALAAGAKSASGTVLRFASSEAGALSLAIAKAKSGATPIATLTRSISAGPVKVPLSGRIGNKPLRPGRYRLALTARDAAGNASAPVALPFTILPPAG